MLEIKEALEKLLANERYTQKMLSDNEHSELVRLAVKWLSNFKQHKNEVIDSVKQEIEKL